MPKKKEAVDKQCPHCQSTFRTTYSHKKFCSKDCTNKAKYIVTKQKRDYFKYDRNYALLYNYGISEEEYEKMHSSQDGKCAICKSPETKMNKKTGKPFRLAVDHCHTTKQIRGLLCKRCNLILGWVNDDTSILAQGISYLEKGA